MPQHDAETAKTLNTLAREQLRHKLLSDILMDIQICVLEGWPWREYVQSLRDELDRILTKQHRGTK